MTFTGYKVNAYSPVSHESLLRQKARSRWIKEGDCNSLFFHLLVNFNCMNNTMKGVMADGCWNVGLMNLEG